MKVEDKKNGLTDQTIKKIQKVFENNRKIESVYLYGSRAKGNYRNGSDIDLTIKNSNVSYSDILKIETELDDLMTPYTIDLSIFEKIENDQLIAHINQLDVEFYKKEGN
ncbi:MAG: hypothetical protein COA86_15210 [Kangiella sp.]|nr:MAG: hypothetical protein COA86_15210 [Kangiella sp.]